MNYTEALAQYMENEDLSTSEGRFAKLWDIFKQNPVPLKSLLSSLEPYLADSKEISRLRSLKFLAKVIHHQHEITDSELLPLIPFFIGMTKEAISKVAAFKGILRALQTLKEHYEGTYIDLMNLLASTNVALYDEKGRRTIMKIYIELYKKYPELVCKNSKEYLENWTKAIKGENSHINCKIIFEHTANLLKGFPSSVLSANAKDVFKVLSMYFPVRISKSVLKIGDLQKDISTSLINCFTSNSIFAEYVFPFFMDKLKSLSVDTTLDTLFAVVSCIQVFSLESYAKYLPSLNDTLHILLKENINPDVLTLAIEVQTAIWDLSFEKYPIIFKETLIQYMTDIKGNVENQASLLIKHAIEGSVKMCCSVFEYGAVESMANFSVLPDGMHKSVLLRSITRVLYECLRKFLENSEDKIWVEVVLKQQKTVEEFCKEVLLGTKQYDRYDILVVINTCFFMNFVMRLQHEPTLQKAVKQLVDILQSRLIEEKKFQEIAIASLMLLPEKVLDTELNEYLNAQFKVLEDINKKVQQNVTDPRKIVSLQVLSACCSHDGIFLKFTDVLMTYMKETLSIQNMSNNQADWLYHLLASFTNAVMQKVNSAKEGAVLKVLEKFVIEFPTEITSTKNKKAADEYIQGIAKVVKYLKGTKIGDSLFSKTLGIAISLKEPAQIIRFRLKILLSLCDSLSEELLNDPSMYQQLYNLAAFALTSETALAWYPKLCELLHHLTSSTAPETAINLMKIFNKLPALTSSPIKYLLQLLLAFSHAAANPFQKEWILEVLREGSKDNSEQFVESMLKTWKKAVRKGAQDSKSLIHWIRDAVLSEKQAHPESYLLTLLQFLLEPDHSPKAIATYSHNALKAISALPVQIKEKDYILPILAFIISAEAAPEDRVKIVEELTPILLQIVKTAKIKTRLKGLGLLLTVLRNQNLSKEKQENVLAEFKKLLLDQKRSVRTFARACINEILSSL